MAGPAASGTTTIERSWSGYNEVCVAGVSTGERHLCSPRHSRAVVILSCHEVDAALTGEPSTEHLRRATSQRAGIRTDAHGPDLFSNFRNTANTREKQ